MTIDRKHAGPRLSQVVVHADTVYLAGIVADHPIPDAGAQTGQILDKIDQYLREAGTDKSKILLATLWLADMRDYGEMNSVWDRWVPAGNTPAHACVEARLAKPEYLVEIRVVAAK
ncbi:MAG TPA: RidA family protein [Burkholderiales bacterium]|nr:RidA family protein [Burkholderiales bacterium]